MASPEMVLVTGGAGYLASWTIGQLLERGFEVRTTLRNRARAEAIRARVGGSDRLEIVEADLLSDTGWAEATAGMRYVIHTAAPMTAKGPELQEATRQGTLRVLRAARDAGVQRVVVTSSGYAAQPPLGPRGSITNTDETIWADPHSSAAGDYARAKTMAERDAWDFAAAHPEIELSTVLPGFMLGPLKSTEIGPSMQLLDMVLKGRLPALPDIGMTMVDIRDVADLHIRAMTATEAAGQRFLAGAEFLWFRDLAALLRRELGPDAGRVSTRRMPDLVLRAIAMLVPPMRDFLPRLGRELHFDHAKATNLLGWQPRPVRDTVISAARDLLER